MPWREIHIEEQKRRARTGSHLYICRLILFLNPELLGGNLPQLLTSSKKRKSAGAKEFA